MFVVATTMTPRPRPSIIGSDRPAMADLRNTSRQISISLDQAEPPISGTVVAGTDPPRSFTGWVGLLAELQAAVGDTDAGEKSSWSRPR